MKLYDVVEFLWQDSFYFLRKAILYHQILRWTNQSLKQSDPRMALQIPNRIE